MDFFHRGSTSGVLVTGGLVITSIMDPVPWIPHWMDGSLTGGGGWVVSTLLQEGWCMNRVVVVLPQLFPSKNHGVFAGNVRIKG